MGIMQRVRDGDWSHLGKPGRSKLAEFAAKRRNATAGKSDDDPSSKSQTCRVGGKVYKIAKMRNGKKLTCGGKKRVQLNDASKVQALRDSGGEFEGKIAGKPYNVNAEMLLAANKMGVSQLMLAANRVPASVQTALRRKFNQMTIGDTVVKVRPERPPKSEPKPPRVPELMVDDIPQNDFTKKWKGAWANADVPKDLLKVLAKLEPPDETGGGKSKTAFYRSNSGIYMKDYVPGEGRGDNVYRHEFGHYADDMIGNALRAKPTPSRAEILTKIFGSDKNHDFADLSHGDRLKRWDEGAQKIKERIENDSGEILTREIEGVRQYFPNISEDVIKKKAQQNLSRSLASLSSGSTLSLYNDQLKADLYDAAGIPRIYRDDTGDRLDGYIKTYSRQGTAPYISDTPEWEKALRTESRQLQKERRERSVGGYEALTLKNAYAEVERSAVESSQDSPGSADAESVGAAARDRVTMDAVKKAAQEVPAFAAIVRLMDREIPDDDDKALTAYRRMVSPTGDLASRAQMLDGLRYLANTPELEHLFDAVGATTKNKIGWGHSDSYYTKGNKGRETGTGQQATEVFANLTDMHAYSADSRAIAEYFLPIQYAEYKRVLAEFGNS